MATEIPHDDVRAMRRLRIKEVAILPGGANRGAKVLFFKGDPEALWKRQFSREERERMARNGQALSDGSFPIATVGDLRNAVSAFGRASDKPRARRHIIRRARALGRTDLLPEAWGVKMAKTGEPTGARKDALMFDDVRRAAIAMSAVNAISRRVSMLFDSIESIVHADDVEDRAAAIRASAEQFVESLDKDLPGMLAGEITKGEATAPTRADLTEALKLRDTIARWLAAAPAGDGEGMKKLTVEFEKTRVGPEAAERIGKMLDVDIEGWEEPQVAAYKGAVESAIAEAERTASTYAVAIEHQKRADDAGDGDPDDDEAALAKAVATLPPPLRKRWLEREAQSARDKADMEKIREDAEQQGAIAKARAFGSIPSMSEAEVAQLIRKTSGTDVWPLVERMFKALHEMADVAKVLDEFGVSDVDDDGAEQGTALEIAEKRAASLQKSDKELSRDGALARVWEKYPALYAQHIRETRASAQH